MPYFVNKTTGKLEQSEAPSQEHEYPIVSPEGVFGSAPADAYHKLIEKGYQPASSKHLQDELDYDRLGTPGQQLLTGVESAAKTATFGLSTGAEVAAGVNPEDIRKRGEINPVARVTGDVAGAVGSLALPGGGIISAAGKLAAKQAATKLGARVAREAVEGIVFQAGDEVSKKFINDPNQTVQSVVANVGLSGLLGGSVGAAFHGGEKVVAPIWEATQGSKMGRLLTALKDRTQTTAGMAEVEKMAKASGIDVSPEMRAAMTEEGQALGSSLRESATKSGKKYQESLNKLYQDTSDQALEGLGKSRKDAASVADLSDYEQGVSARDALIKEVDDSYGPVAKEYDAIKSKVSNNIIENPAVLQENLSKVAMESGQAVRPGSDEAKLMKSIIKDAGNVKSLADLELFQSSVNSELSQKMMFGLRGKVMKSLRDSEEAIITAHLGKDAPELLGQYAKAREGYRAMMDKIDLVSDRLKPGKFSGPKGFVAALKEMAPEDVIRRINPIKDVELQQHLAQHFPAAAYAAKNYHINGILKKAANAPRALEEGVDTRVLFKQLDSLQPEARDFLLSSEQQSKLNAVKGLLEKLPERMNPSGTSKSIDDKLSFLQGGTAGLMLDLMTGGGGAFTLLGSLAKYIGRDVPDALKLSLLKVLGTEGPIDAVAFKGMVNAAEQAYKAQKASQKAVKSIFTAGSMDAVKEVSKDEIKHLDRLVADATESPESSMEKLSHYSSYLPDQATAAGMLTSRAVAYLSALKPKTGGATPMDPPRVPDAIEQARYNRALSICERPALVLKSIKDGSLTKDDVMTLGMVYPDLYKSYQAQVMDELTDHQASGKPLPYKNIVSLSLFMQMPLESSTLPQVMSANQALQMGMAAEKQERGTPKESKLGPFQKGAQELSNGVAKNQTNQQARRQDRLKP